MRIDSETYLLASGRAGFDLTDAFDCHVWAFDAESRIVLVDSGAGRDVAALIERGTASGLAWTRPVTVLLTHGHGDHAGGAAALRRELNAVIVAGAMTAGWLSAGNEAAVSLPAARDAGIYPADYRLEACPVTQIVEPGAALQLGSLKATAVATPGHSADHLSWLIERGSRRDLCVGDALFADGKVVLQDTWDCDVQASMRSIDRLGKIEFDGFFPGHGAFSLRGGKRHVETAQRRMRSLLAPSLLV